MEHPLITVGEIVILSLLTIATTIELVWQMISGASITVVLFVFLLAYIFGDLTYTSIREAVRKSKEN